MTIEEYYVNMRRDLLEIITGVENADDCLFWDDTMPNSVTQGKLDKIFMEYMIRAIHFGLLLVTRHCSCSNPLHSEYVITNFYDLPIPYEEDKYIRGDQLFQGERYCVCPCTKNAEPTMHWVIDDILYSKDANLEQCKRLESILYDINEAISCASHSKPRSGIREYLLRAVLNINDELLPTPMDEYVRRIKGDDA